MFIGGRVYSLPTIFELKKKTFLPSHWPSGLGESEGVICESGCKQDYCMIHSVNDTTVRTGYSHQVQAVQL